MTPELKNLAITKAFKNNIIFSKPVVKNVEYIATRNVALRVNLLLSIMRIVSKDMCLYFLKERIFCIKNRSKKFFI